MTAIKIIALLVTFCVAVSMVASCYVIWRLFRYGEDEEEETSFGKSATFPKDNR